ncbi:LacI family DNA-binding transcriptional regulator [Neobacillus sp. NPDC093127]|uniref:LacI family DNA-binding transcriptional regulator n=1 Tax=Neobacillus sp. NPDC093127 TaxID=3364296 RepID=UPI0038245D79
MTIKDVANEAGVSIATVSRVLNNKDRVKNSTRKKIEEAIQKLDFRPDQIARTMIKKETKTIGLLVPNLKNEFWAGVATAIQDELWEKGFTTLLCATTTFEDSAEREEAFIRNFIQRRVDGVIYATLSGYHSTGYHPAIKELIDSNIPVVAFDQDIPDISKVRGAHLQGALIAVEHLIRLGHNKIAYLGGPLFSPDRELGFRNAHTLNGLTVNEAIIKRGTPTHEFGSTAMLELLKSMEKFTAVFCANDMIALGAMQCLINAGVRIPEDVAVVGYDDIQMAHLTKPALTTIQQPIREMGSSVVNLLLNLIEDNNRPAQKLIFDMKLIVRESCGGMPMSKVKNEVC